MVSHPLDLVPCDFLFSIMKKNLKLFQDVKTKLLESLNSISSDDYNKCIEQ